MWFFFKVFFMMLKNLLLLTNFFIFTSNVLYAIETEDQDCDRSIVVKAPISPDYFSKLPLEMNEKILDHLFGPKNGDRQYVIDTAAKEEHLVALQLTSKGMQHRIRQFRFLNTVPVSIDMLQEVAEGKRGINKSIPGFIRFEPTLLINKPQALKTWNDLGETWYDATQAVQKITVTGKYIDKLDFMRENERKALRFDSNCCSEYSTTIGLNFFKTLHMGGKHNELSIYFLFTLTSLTFDPTFSTKDEASISSLSELKKLTITGQFHKLSIAEMDVLETLSFEPTFHAKDLVVLKSMESLKTLQIGGIFEGELRIQNMGALEEIVVTKGTSLAKSIAHNTSARIIYPPNFELTPQPNRFLLN